MINTNFKDFVNENEKPLFYYMFDFDDNILVMKTVIHIDQRINGKWQPIDVSTSEFKEIRPEIYKRNSGEDTDWRFRNDDVSQTYCEFRDSGPRGENAFYNDAIKSIKANDFGPVWDTFIRCLTEGSIFLIITARGHEPNSIKKVVKWIISNCMTNVQRGTMIKNLKEFNILFGIDDKGWSNDKLIDFYLSFCEFIGINSQHFANVHGKYDPSKPEQGKELGISDFVDKIYKFGKEVKRKVAVGFSDDDLSTVEHIHSYIKNELSLQYTMDFNVYYTADGVTKMK